MSDKLKKTVEDHPLTGETAQKKTWPQQIRRWLLDAVFVLAMLFAGIILLPKLFGYQNYVIVSGSMTGTIDRGAMLYTKNVASETLKVGDIITYIPPNGAGPNAKEPITHRIVFIGRDKEGSRVFRTKGDFNKNPDSWKFVLNNAKQPKYAFQIPYLGFVLAALALRPVRLLLIGFPALLIAFSIFWGLWTEAGEEMKKEQAAKLEEDERPDPKEAKRVIDQGAILYTKNVPSETLKVGDIITHVVPNGAGPNAKEPITHKNIFIGRDKEDSRVLRTKSDFNKNPDSWKFVLNNAKQPKYAFQISYLGFVLAALALRPVRSLLIRFPALLLAFPILWGLWFKAGEETKKVQASKLEKDESVGKTLNKTLDKTLKLNSTTDHYREQIL